MPGPLCSSCGAAVSAGEAMRNPRLCPACREAYDSAEARRARAVAERDERAYRIDGQPWWLCGRPQVVVRYMSFAHLTAEFEAATGHSWRVAQTDSTDGDANIGRYIIFGALALLSPATEGPSRSPGNASRPEWADQTRTR